VSVSDEAAVSPRVFVSYAHDNDEHVERVSRFCAFLRGMASMPVGIFQRPRCHRIGRCGCYGRFAPPALSW
jgi:hypothetical protein